jgi:hypothetical protein
MCVFLSTLSHKIFQQNWKINWESKATLQLVVVFSTSPQCYAMLDVVTFHSQLIISFNALLSFLLKFSTDLEGILVKKLLRKKVPNCTKFKTPFKICALFLLIWKIGGLIKFFLGGQRINLYPPFETSETWDLFQAFFAPSKNNWSEILFGTFETLYN